MLHPSLLVGLGAASSIFLSSYGAAAASSQAGILAVRCVAETPFDSFRCFSPIISSGILAIYGIIIAVILVPHMKDENLAEVDGYMGLCAGLAVGLACACSGLGTASFISDYMYDQGVHTVNKKWLRIAPTLGTSIQEPLLTSASDSAYNGRVSKPMGPPSWQCTMVIIFFEAIGLYGLIVALLLVP